MKKHNWQLIDRHIENEDKNREDYIITQQVSKTLLDILKEFTEFAILCFFSITYPLCFCLAFLGGIARVHLNKWKFTIFLKRPLP